MKISNSDSVLIVCMMQVVSNGYRPDLKAAALARLAAVHKSLRVAKAGQKKKVSKARKSSKN